MEAITEEWNSIHTQATTNNTMPEQTTNPTNTNAQPNPATPSLDDVHSALSDARRRHVLRTLHEKGPLQKKEVARWVAAIENEKIRDDLTEQEHKRVVVSLHQSHLPLLDKHGFVSWDEATNMVSLGPHSRLVLRYLEGITLDDETESENADGSVSRADAGESIVDRVAKSATSFF